MNWHRLTRDWEGRSVYLIGGGPSLKGFDFERIRNKGVIVAVNDAARVLPWADVVISIDTVWMRNREDLLLSHSAQKIMGVSDGYGSVLDGVLYVRRVKADGVSDDPFSVHTGENSGFAALGMAMQRGAARAALLGYDMTFPGHWHGGYSWRVRRGYRDYPRWVAMFASLRRAATRLGTDIINCNPNSNIRSFPFGSPEDIAE